MNRKDVLKKMNKDDKLLKLSGGVYPGAARPKLQLVSTGNIALDWCISDKLIGGGLPIGRVVEIFGDPSTGKSLVVAGMMGNVQALGGIAIYDDVEECRDEEFMKLMGCDVSEEAMSSMSTTTVEEHFQSVERQIELIRSTGFDKPIVVVLDSLAALTTRHEKEVGLDKVDMSRAKVIKAAMRLLGGKFARKNVLYIVNNHKIANIGGNNKFRSQKLAPSASSPGGGGVKFQASVRIDLNISNFYQDEKGLVTGVKVRADVVKNKLAPPFRRCYLDCWYKEGVDKFSGCLDILIHMGLVKSSGSGWYLYKNEEKKLREDDVIKRFVEDSGGLGEEKTKKEED